MTTGQNTLNEYVISNSFLGYFAAVLPSLIGIMLGSFVGVRILKVAKPTFIRWMVIGILFFAGLKAISKGLESYGVTFF